MIIESILKFFLYKETRKVKKVGNEWPFACEAMKNNFFIIEHLNFSRRDQFENLFQKLIQFFKSTSMIPLFLSLGKRYWLAKLVLKKLGGHRALKPFHSWWEQK